MSPKSQEKIHGYDQVLKLLFSHPIMIENLIKGFIDQAWTKELDFSSLKKINVKHTSDDLRTRENDLIWKISFKGEPLYLICLLEFQSVVDNFMAVRILTYVGLIYQDLIKQQHLTSKEDKLPPVFSFVFHTGTKCWDAPVQLKDCLTCAIPPTLRKYQPNIEYMVLDIGQIDVHKYTFENNIVSSFIELERVGDLANMHSIINRLIEQLKDKRFNSLRKAFVVYINRVWKPRRRFAAKEFIELTEVSLMLSERIDQWEEEKIQQGRIEGRQEGRQEGRLEGILELLNHKFPSIPEAYISKLQQSHSDELKMMFKKILHANNVEELID